MISLDNHIPSKVKDSEEFFSIRPDLNSPLRPVVAYVQVLSKRFLAQCDYDDSNVALFETQVEARWNRDKIFLFYSLTQPLIEMNSNVTKTHAWLESDPLLFVDL